MGGFSNFFDRPAPRVTSLVKNPTLQGGISNLGSDYTANADVSKSGLGDYISKYLAGQKAAETQTGQETGAIDQFYNGGVSANLAQLRNQRSSAMTDAANRASAYAVRGVKGNMVANDGGASSYDTRQAVRNVTDVQTQAALDNANQARQDYGYVTGNQIGLAGARTGLQNTLAARSLVPGQASSDVLRRNEGDLQGVVGLDQANKFYGIKQDPGILDRLRQEQQFVSGLGSLMKDQYGTAAEAYGGWASAGMGGGGGGGMGSMMGGMGGGGGMARGGMVRLNDYRGGGRVYGPGTETSDSVPANLSEGEFVVPAAAVKMPGVLPWLKQLRARALNFQAPPDRLPGRYESGGLIYANDFGGLGSMAFNYDALNEKSQQTASAAGQQDRQFQQNQAAEAQRHQDQIDQEILKRYQSGRQQQVGGGYTPEDNFQPGGAIESPGMTFSRGGLVRGYAGGGPVEQDSSDVLHRMAMKAAYEMSKPGWQSNENRSLDIHAQREADYGKRWDREEALRESYLKIAKDQAEKAKTDLTPVQAAAAERKNSLLHSLASSYVQQGDVDGIANIHGLDPEVKATYSGLAMRQNQALANSYQRAKGVADLQNEKSRLDTLVPDLEKNIKEGTHWYSNDEAMPDWQRTVDYHKNKQQQIRSILASPAMKPHLALTTPDENGNFAPAVDAPPAVRSINYAPPPQIPGSAPVSPGPTNAPSLYQAGRRYGNLRYMGGDPNVETSWQPVQAQ